MNIFQNFSFLTLLVWDSHWPVDDECHCLTVCIVGRDYRPALFDEVARRNCKFTQLCFVNKFKTLVCPIYPTDTKQVSRFIERQFNDRDKIDLGCTAGILPAAPQIQSKYSVFVPCIC